MLATGKSAVLKPAHPPRPRPRSAGSQPALRNEKAGALHTKRGRGGICTAVWVLACLNVLAQTNRPAIPSAGQDAALRLAQRTFREAQTRFHDEPANAIAAWQFGKACFDLAEFATGSGDRAALAEQGIAAGRRASASASNSPPAHYYLALNLGQLARTKSLGALRLVSEMEREFMVAAALDEHFDYGGPHRSLGLLYRDAPFIGSVGDRGKARWHLQRAVELVPDYPPNRLCLIEAMLKWGDRNGAARELTALEEAWPGARASLMGVISVSSWADWETRLKKAQRKVEESRKTLESPRH